MINACRTHFNRKPKPKQVGSYPFQGATVKGMLLKTNVSPLDGQPVAGVIEYFSISEQGADKVAQVANSIEMDDDDVDQVWQKAQKRQRIQTQTQIQR